jgi:hypothetical protein
VVFSVCFLILVVVVVPRGHHRHRLTVLTNTNRRQTATTIAMTVRTLSAPRDSSIYSETVSLTAVQTGSPQHQFPTPILPTAFMVVFSHACSVPASFTSRAPTSPDSHTSMSTRISSVGMGRCLVGLCATLM